MALWYYNPDPSKITFRREYLKTDAYLYLPGPSLAMVDFDVRIEGTTAFAINTAYPKVKPNIWLGMDKPECYDARLLWESFPKIFRGSYWKLDYRDMHLRDYPQVYFADIEKPEKGIRDMFLLNKDEIYFAWFNHSLGAILHVMLWMGAKKIHFVGCDLGGNRDYWMTANYRMISVFIIRLFINNKNVSLRSLRGWGKNLVLNACHVQTGPLLINSCLT